MGGWPVSRGGGETRGPQRGVCATNPKWPSTITTINKQINKTPPRPHPHHLCFALARTRSIQDPRKTLSATSGLMIL